VGGGGGAGGGGGGGGGGWGGGGGVGGGGGGRGRGRAPESQIFSAAFERKYDCGPSRRTLPPRAMVWRSRKETSARGGNFGLRTTHSSKRSST